MTSEAEVLASFRDMAPKTGLRREIRKDDENGDGKDEDFALWTAKAGRKTGFDFLTNSAIFGTGEEIPVEFLAEEARRDGAVYGRVIPIDSIDFATVRDGFYRRLESFLRTKKPELHSSKRSSASNSVREKKMDGHAGRRSPFSELPSDVKLFTRQQEPTGACSSPKICSPPPLSTPVREDIRAGNDDSSTFLPSSSSVNAILDDASSSNAHQSLQCGRDTPCEARSGQETVARRRWSTGEIAMYEQLLGNGGHRFVTVEVTTPNRVTEEGGFSSESEGGQVAVTDGAKCFFVPEERLTELVVPSCFVARLQSGSGASPSGFSTNTSQTNVLDAWDWLTPVGLAQAKSLAVQVPKRAVSHLVGKGGATIRMIEEVIGVVIGIIDGQDGQASVSLVGPQHRVAAAQSIIQAVIGGGAWSLLHRIKDRGPLFA